MALKVTTNNPTALLRAIRESISKKEIETWTDDRGDFTHTPDQWKFKAWMKPIVLANELKFVLVGNDGIPTTKAIYAVYHGRLSEMLLSHFDNMFINTIATSNPDGDILNSKQT